MYQKVISKPTRLTECQKITNVTNNQKTLRIYVKCLKMYKKNEREGTQDRENKEILQGVEWGRIELLKMKFDIL